MRKSTFSLTTIVLLLTLPAASMAQGTQIRAEAGQRIDDIGWSAWKDVAKVSSDEPKTLLSLGWRTFKADNVDNLEVQWRFTYHHSPTKKKGEVLLSVRLAAHRFTCAAQGADEIKQGTLLLTKRISLGESAVPDSIQIEKKGCDAIVSVQFNSITKLVEYRKSLGGNIFPWSKFGTADIVP